jgi:anti-sigma B factor antagonist
MSTVPEASAVGATLRGPAGLGGAQRGKEPMMDGGVGEAAVEATVEVGRFEGGSLTICIAGELDPSTADRVRDEVTERVAEHEVEELLLDLSGVTFMDSAGVRVIVELHHEQRRRSRRLWLVNIADPSRRVLEISGLTAELERR